MYFTASFDRKIPQKKEIIPEITIAIMIVSK